MLDLLRPDRQYHSIAAIPLAELHHNGIRGLVIDLDNTITEWNGQELRPEVAGWFNSARDLGFKACIISNNTLERGAGITRLLQIPLIHNAGKPRRRCYLKAIKLLGVSSGTTAVIGDQIFTDILGGNRAGMTTILVNPISQREFIGTRLVRQLERIVLRRMRLSGGDGL